jgi:hypothetical protein
MLDEVPAESERTPPAPAIVESELTFPLTPDESERWPVPVTEEPDGRLAVVFFESVSTPPPVMEAPEARLTEVPPERVR